MLRVDLDVVIKEYLEEISTDVRKKLRKARIGYSKLGSTETSVSVKIRKKEDFRVSKDLLTNVDLKSDVEFDSNGFVKITPRDEALEERKLLACLLYTSAAADE